MIKFLDLKSQYQSIKEEIDKALFGVVSNSAFIKGKYLEVFESEFADYCEVNHCVGCGNGTDALELAIESLQLPQGSEIIVPANTFVATAEAVLRCGHKIRYADCDPDNYTLSVDSLKEQINPNTAAVIAVHLYGHSCDMRAIMEICKKNNLRLIEDCAQAHGAKFENRRVGSFGDVAAFSFYPGKNLGAYGDAGCIVTNDHEIADLVYRIANHGAKNKFDHDIVGRNSRLDGLQAAILSVKLKHLDKWNKMRRSIAAYYNEYLADTDLILPKTEEWAEPVFHLYVVRSKTRNSLMDYLNENGIQTGIHYPVAVPKLKAYNKSEQITDHFVACKIDSELLSLPMGEHLTENDIKIISETIKK